MKTSGTKLATSNSKWHNEWRRVTTNYKEWQLMTTNDNEWLFPLTFLLFRIIWCWYEYLNKVTLKSEFFYSNNIIATFALNLSFCYHVFITSFKQLLSSVGSGANRSLFYSFMTETAIIETGPLICRAKINGFVSGVSVMNELRPCQASVMELFKAKLMSEAAVQRCS